VEAPRGQRLTPTRTPKRAGIELQPIALREKEANQVLNTTVARDEGLHRGAVGQPIISACILLQHQCRYAPIRFFYFR
jgi:hypothetical protein